jgi:hypothetical protein
MAIIYYNSQATGKKYIIKLGTGIQINMTMRTQALTEEKTKDMTSQLLQNICLVVSEGQSSGINVGSHAVWSILPIPLGTLSII